MLDVTLNASPARVCKEKCPGATQGTSVRTLYNLDRTIRVLKRILAYRVGMMASVYNCFASLMVTGRM